MARTGCPPCASAHPAAAVALPPCIAETPLHRCPHHWHLFPVPTHCPGCARHTASPTECPLLCQATYPATKPLSVLCLATSFPIPWFPFWEHVFLLQRPGAPTQLVLSREHKGVQHCSLAPKNPGIGCPKIISHKHLPRPRSITMFLPLPSLSLSMFCTQE